MRVFRIDKDLFSDPLGCADNAPPLARRRTGTFMTKTHERRPLTSTTFLVIWWMSKTPYAAVFTNRLAAEAAANVRNAIVVTIKGDHSKVEEVVDWYRRDEEGRPMPAEWRELLGHLHATWHAKPIVKVGWPIGAPSGSSSTMAEA